MLRLLINSLAAVVFVVFWGFVALALLFIISMFA